MVDPDNRFLDEIEREEAGPPPGAGSALALTGAVLTAGVVLIGIPAVLILLFA